MYIQNNIQFFLYMEDVTKKYKPKHAMREHNAAILENYPSLVKYKDSVRSAYIVLMHTYMHINYQLGKFSNCSSENLIIINNGTKICVGVVFTKNGMYTGINFGPVPYSMDAEFRPIYYSTSVISNVLKELVYDANVVKLLKSIGIEIPSKIYEALIIFILASISRIFLGYDKVALKSGINTNFIGLEIFVFDDKFIEQFLNHIKTWPSLFSTKSSGAKGSFPLASKMSLIPVQQLDNLYGLRNKFWREVLIGQMCHQLILNNVCTNYSMFIDWFLFNNNDHKYLFVNDVNKFRIKHATLIKSIVGDVERSRRKLFHKGSLLHVKFDKFADELRVPINFAERYMIYSSYISNILFVRAGATLHDKIVLDGSSMTSPKDRRAHKLFNSFSSFKNAVFELIYGLYCLNYHFGIIHNDLHLNNICLNITKITWPGGYAKKSVEEQNEFYYNSAIAYDVHGRLYLRKDVLFSFCVIDFGRSIIGQDALKKTCLVYTNYIDMLNYQKSLIKHIYSQEFPEFYKKNQYYLESMIHDKYEIFIVNYAAYDIYRFCVLLKQLFMTTGKLTPLYNPDEIKRRHIPFLDVLINFTRKRLTEDMITEQARQNPNLEMIDLYFEDMLESNVQIDTTKGSLCDIFAVERPLTYSNARGSLPPYMDVERPEFKDYIYRRHDKTSKNELEIPDHLPYDERIEEYVDISQHYKIE